MSSPPRGELPQNNRLGDAFRNNRSGHGTSKHNYQRDNNSPHRGLNRNNSSHRGVNRNNSSRGGGNNRRGAPQRTNSRQQHQTYDHLPLEHGVICSLRDSFGFIHCADRVDEIFFHYSSVLPIEGNNSPHPSDALQMDMEVQFRIGSQQGRNDGKLAAFQVQSLPKGTISWETVVQKRAKGLVERGNPRDGTIRLLVDEEEHQEGTPGEDGTTTIKAKAVGPLVRFAAKDCTARVTRGDLVQFKLVEERRSKDKWARKIKVLLTDRERQRQEQERKMLEEATVEHGVISSLKGDYGFLRSNKRREDVFFHYSSIEPSERDESTHYGEDELFPGTDELVLKEGQDMKFLVVKDASGSGRISARAVQMQPRGSVRFHDVIATGVTGTVSLVPQPQDSGHALDTKGKVLLTTPLPDMEEQEDGTSKKRMVTEVYLSSQDSPGGSFDFRGGSSVGVWVEVGDLLLFDVVKDISDGACRAVPTHRMEAEREAPMDPKKCQEADSISDDDKRIKLLKMSLPMRSEGVVNALKDTYGFIHFAERPVDAHFKLFQLLPDQLQKDLRKSMGLENTDRQGNPLQLSVGAEVQFDMSVHGNISAGPRQQQRSKQQNNERENLKAQRVLLLPPGTIRQNITIGEGVRGVVRKENTKHSNSGIVDLDDVIPPVSPEDQHPFVAAMIREFLQDDRINKIQYDDVQSGKEDKTVIDMIERLGEGQLKYFFVPKPGDFVSNGKLCIEKLSAEDIATAGIDIAPISGDAHEETDVDVDLSTPKKKVKSKTIRFDRSHFCKALKDEIPPAEGDIVKMDIVQIRRTGHCHPVNLAVVERNSTSAEFNSGVGVVNESVVARKFGFISRINEAEAEHESLFFSFDNVFSGSNEPLQKGDEVKFDIQVEKGGKRVAVNVAPLPKGTIPTNVDSNTCQGLILMIPSHSILKNTPTRTRSSDLASMARAKATGGRWDKVVLDDDKVKQQTKDISKEDGFALLLHDPSGMFGKLAQDDQGYLRYRSDALAIHGKGSSTSSDIESKPRRGDLVSFVKSKKGTKHIRDIRIVERGAGKLIRGLLQGLMKDDSGQGGSAKFVCLEGDDTYDVDLSKIVACIPSGLKEKEPVEGMLHGGILYGVCRVADLYLETKSGSSRRERPKLNLAVKKDRGGTIMAQSMMAKGPDDTNGFAAGWTTRTSKYVQDPEEG